MSKHIDLATHQIKAEVYEEIAHVGELSDAHIRYRDVIGTLLDAIDRVKEHVNKARDLKSNMQPDVTKMTSDVLLDLTLENIEESITKTLYGENDDD